MANLLLTAGMFRIRRVHSNPPMTWIPVSIRSDHTSDQLRERERKEDGAYRHFNVHEYDVQRDTISLAICRPPYVIKRFTAVVCNMDLIACFAELPIHDFLIDKLYIVVVS